MTSWHWVRTIGSSGWDSGHRVTRHQVFGLDSEAPRHLARSGLRVNRHDSGHRVIWLASGAPRHQHWMSGFDSGHRVTRHQVIWLASMGTALSGKAVGTGVTRVTALDRLGYDSGHRVTRHQVNLARRGAPRHLGKGSGL
ncbi:unnamed protein product [Staurois parvus]|uniref:Uncharacterized protein n=1 Tax=Staurois parvus TaxID=386267 RepID=A0ABN9CAL1_9NEOB|nr:unnamed protein product [Staurois parvus]